VAVEFRVRSTTMANYLFSTILISCIFLVSSDYVVPKEQITDDEDDLDGVPQNDGSVDGSGFGAELPASSKSADFTSTTKISGSTSTQIAVGNGNVVAFEEVRPSNSDQVLGLSMGSLAGIIAGIVALLIILIIVIIFLVIKCRRANANSAPTSQEHEIVLRRGSSEKKSLKEQV